MQENRACPPDHVGAKGHSDTSFRPSVKAKFCPEYFMISGASFQEILTTRKIKYMDVSHVGLGLETIGNT